MSIETKGSESRIGKIQRSQVKEYKYREIVNHVKRSYEGRVSNMTWHGNTRSVL